MRTLPREPYRGGQICGYQTNVGGWSEGESEYCGEFKKPGSPLCEEHDKEMREEHGGVLPRFAPGNAPGLALRMSQWGWSVYDDRDELVASADKRIDLVKAYGFELKWEPYEGTAPIDATPEEIAAWGTS